jgi:hypothetical protein
MMLLEQNFFIEPYLYNLSMHNYTL